MNVKNGQIKSLNSGEKHKNKAHSFPFPGHNFLYFYLAVILNSRQ
jgi:hypothetical protein